LASANLLGSWVRRFLLEHVIAERNLSKNTQRSYRDTFSILLPWISKRSRHPIDHLCIADLSRDVLKDFLDHLEHERHCKIRTRNQRLAAIHAMARFVAEHSPELVAWCATIRAVPFKRFHRPQLTYLEKPQMDALLAAPDRNTVLGRRDYTLLLFLYNSGARVSEASSLPINKLNGKGAAVKPVTKQCPECLSAIPAKAHRCSYCASVQKEKPIAVPDETLLNYIDLDELKKFKESGTGIFSITVYAEKP